VARAAAANSKQGGALNWGLIAARLVARLPISRGDGERE